MVAKITVVGNTLDPTWPLMEILVATLCNGDYSRQLKFEAFDHDNRGDDDLVGEFTTNLDELKDAVKQNRAFACMNSKKLSRRKYADSGSCTYRTSSSMSADTGAKVSFFIYNTSTKRGQINDILRAHKCIFLEQTMSPPPFPSFSTVIPGP